MIERTVPDLPPAATVAAGDVPGYPGRPLVPYSPDFSGGRVLGEERKLADRGAGPGGQPESPPGPPLFPLPGQPPAHEEPTLPPPGLSVTVTGLHNAVTAGEEMTYYVRVKNSGSTPEHQVVLTAAVPAAMAIDPLGTSGPPPAKYTYHNHVVTFTPSKPSAPARP